MEDDHYPTSMSVIVEIWKYRLSYNLSLPYRTYVHFTALARRYYNEMTDTIFYYLTKGTVYDINADREKESR